MNKQKILRILFILLPFVIAFPSHFIYNYISFPLLSIYFPVNESIFEHIKLLFTPTIITFLIFYFIASRKLDKQRYLSSLIISIVSSIFVMLLLFYLFNLIFGKEVMILSIISLFIGVISGQLLAIFTYKNNIKWSIEISIFSLITVTFIFLLFTLNPPLLEFFYDKEKLSYGLYK